jgi:hypothetical protein
MTHTLALLVALWSAPLPPPPSIAPSFVLRGDSVRSDAEIRIAVLRHATEVRRCYEIEGLRRDPALNGFVDLVVTIQPTGMVTNVAVRTEYMSGSGAKEVGKCLATIARNWRFDRGPYAVEVIILPFALTPEGSVARRAGSIG